MVDGTLISLLQEMCGSEGALSLQQQPQSDLGALLPPGVIRDGPRGPREGVEQALKEAGPPDYALHHAMPELVLRIRRDGTYLDLRSASGTDLTPAAYELIGTKLSERVPPDVAARATLLIGQAMRTGQPQTFWYQLDVEGELRDYQAVLTPGGEDDVVVLMSDISSCRQLQEHLLQSQKMEAMGHLAGGVAHDFNNLLTAIMGYGMLSMRDAGEKMAANLREIQKAAEHGAELIGRLMSFSRRQAPEPRILNLNDLVSDTAALLNSLISEDIELVRPRRADLGLVRADNVQLELVVVNLVLNARDAMPDGGKLTIEAANVEAGEGTGEHSTDEYVALFVSDTGVGMTPKVMNRIFEPFFTTKSQGKGTGLGLSTCRTIVSQYGGHMSVRSELGKGTTFQVYLPRVYESASFSDAPDDFDLAARGKETVLLVEDEQSVRSVAAAILRQEGYTVVEANDGVEALMLAQHHPPNWIDLLLTDVVMPVMGGSELVDVLRAEDPSMRVLFTSGHGIEAIGRQAVYEDGTSFIPKPFTPSELSHKVRDVLDEGRVGTYN